MSTAKSICRFGRLYVSRLSIFNNSKGKPRIVSLDFTADRSRAKKFNTGSGPGRYMTSEEERAFLALEFAFGEFADIKFIDLKSNVASDGKEIAMRAIEREIHRGL